MYNKIMSNTTNKIKLSFGRNNSLKYNTIDHDMLIGTMFENSIVSGKLENLHISIPAFNSFTRQLLIKENTLNNYFLSVITDALFTVNEEKKKENSFNRILLLKSVFDRMTYIKCSLQVITVDFADIICSHEYPKSLTYSLIDKSMFESAFSVINEIEIRELFLTMSECVNCSTIIFLEKYLDLLPNNLTNLLILLLKEYTYVETESATYPHFIFTYEYIQKLNNKIYSNNEGNNLLRNDKYFINGNFISINKENILKKTIEKNNNFSKLENKIIENINTSLKELLMVDYDFDIQSLFEWSDQIMLVSLWDSNKSFTFLSKFMNQTYLTLMKLLSNNDNYSCEFEENKIIINVNGSSITIYECKDLIEGLLNNVNYYERIFYDGSRINMSVSYYLTYVLESNISLNI